MAGFRGYSRSRVGLPVRLDLAELRNLGLLSSQANG